MFNVAKLANGRAKTRTHGLAESKAPEGVSLQRGCVCERERKGEKRRRQRDGVGEREKEPKSEVRVKPSWAPSAVKTTLSFDE